MIHPQSSQHVAAVPSAQHRTWTVRSKITVLLLLTLRSLAALWTYAAYLSLGDALTLKHVDTIGNHLARPPGEVFISL
ncbi:hypothetical protein [Streptomyces sp. SCL15-6]|uniref:hypothetical protein n=1 Tax=Streptomyces sp. SCL15-6 TaxID=2967222 RepID=UPI002965F9C2|nr:hypothetical protein [Streptomyces sp. SCL15-6]